MSIRALSCLTLLALILGVTGCDKIPKPKRSTQPAATQEEKSKNIGDRYVRGVLGAGNNAKGTAELAAIQKAIQLYKIEKGKNPASLASLHSEGYLSKAPTAPIGKKFDYNAKSGAVKLVAK